MAWNVVHWQVVHVGLDELERLVLDHANGLIVELGAELENLLTRQTLTFGGGFESRVGDLLDVVQVANGVTHAQAEVPEPLVVESDSPILAQELNDVRNNASFVARSQRIEVVLVEADERPQRLQNHLLRTHVSD